MRLSLHDMIYLALLVTFVACDAPPVPLDDIVVEKTFVPEKCERAVKTGDFVRYHYNGMFPDGKKFDSSYDRGSTYNVYVGKKQLIAGMDKALVGMCVNQRSLVKIPPALAYGKNGYGDSIPADAILHFDVLLLDIWNPEDKVQSQTYYKPEKCSRTVQVSDFIRYHYNGTLLDGTLFDSSHNRMRTYDTYVGIGWLIAGMDQGLLGMCVGEKRIITLPPSLGYGENGDGSDIPGQASLVFDVVLLDLHNPKDSISVEDQVVPEACTRKSQEGDFMRYHYNGSLLDGTFFDSSACLSGTKIPGSAVLVFDVHVIDFHNPSDAVQITLSYKPENCSLLSKKGDFVKCHYNATLLDGTPIGSTHSFDRTYDVVLGAGQMVPGMEDGLKDMCVGEKRVLVIPAPPGLRRERSGRRGTRQRRVGL
ncbi:hypothetical protein SKAU_G00404650 [Synaphobranchus kaupii]|uniref:peptidylprolyl isomerase n=1 Tax=Synaphobranchus kaupii TaxID=118154 RepID=A0A9Q1E9R9_SYNKA|nr:hypothetical protein SKAU_G00404650 [Synaphobranchus kaupii]